MLIAIYVTVNSQCVQNFGYTSPVGFIVNTVFSLLLLLLAAVLKRTAYYGLTKAEDPKEYLYFVPLLVIISVNLWSGININNSLREIVFHILTMLNIGFIEEMIFRGFLFKMMEKNGIKSAVAVSSVTFGIGHIINLLYGAELVPTLLQTVSAISVGYLFVIIFYKSKSLIPCIVTHALFNALSVFYVEKPIVSYVSSAFLITAPLIYAVYIHKRVKM